jgi:hypothetical protein
LILLVVPGLASAENWPSWRGPHDNGISAERNLPLEWSATKNVRWKAALAEAGNSTPIVCGDRVFLTQSLDKGKRRAVVCFARADGKKLWQQEVECTVKETTHPDNPPCSSSPVTDGAAEVWRAAVTMMTALSAGLGAVPRPVTRYLFLQESLRYPG